MSKIEQSDNIYWGTCGYRLSKLSYFISAFKTLMCKLKRHRVRYFGLRTFN